MVSDEIVPEVHRLGREKLVTHSLIAGLIPMLLLDTALKSLDATFTFRLSELDP